MTTPEPDPAGAGLRQQVRGSVLLTSGRILAALVNLVIQVLTVRALSQAGYAAFAYALAVAGIGEIIAVGGMHRALVVLLPRYEQERDGQRALGTLVLTALTIVTVGLGFVLVVLAFRGAIAGSLAGEASALTVLGLLSVLGPIMSAEIVLDSVYATLGRPVAIFLRQYVLVPGLRLVAVLVVVVGPGDPVWLAWGYLAGGAVGLLAAGQGLRRLLARHELYRGLRPSLRGLPVRLTALVAIPLFANNLADLALDSLDALMLAQLSSPEQLALLRAVVPLAESNSFVVAGFTVLFTPLAARLFAGREDRELSRLYWSTALWRAVLAFPPLMLVTVLAAPVTVLLFGQRYADAAPLLTALGAGTYLGALAGPNQAVLEVTGRFRPLVVTNVAMIGLLALLNLALIPPLGGFGAALATGSTLVVRSVVTQVIVWRGTPVTLPERALWLPYATLLAAMGVAGLVTLTRPGPLPGAGVAVALTMGVFWVARRQLDVAATFPELARIPVLGALLTGRRR